LLFLFVSPVLAVVFFSEILVALYFLQNAVGGGFSLVGLLFGVGLSAVLGLVVLTVLALKNKELFKTLRLENRLPLFVQILLFCFFLACLAGYSLVFLSAF